MRSVPVGATDIMQPQPEQKPLQPELRILQRQTRGIARATEIADRFVSDRRHVDARQIAGAEQARQFDGVAPVGLDLVAGFLRDERRGHGQSNQVNMECGVWKLVYRIRSGISAIT
jgi:predicted glycosyltransferase